MGSIGTCHAPHPHCINSPGSLPDTPTDLQNPPTNKQDTIIFSGSLKTQNHKSTLGPMTLLFHNSDFHQACPQPFFHTYGRILTYVQNYFFKKVTLSHYRRFPPG